MLREGVPPPFICTRQSPAWARPTAVTKFCHPCFLKPSCFFAHCNGERSSSPTYSVTCSSRPSLKFKPALWDEPVSNGLWPVSRPVLHCIIGPLPHCPGSHTQAVQHAMRLTADSCVCVCVCADHAAAVLHAGAQGLLPRRAV